MNIYIKSKREEAKLVGIHVFVCVLFVRIHMFMFAYCWSMAYLFLICWSHLTVVPRFPVHYVLRLKIQTSLILFIWCSQPLGFDNGCVEEL